MTPTSPTHHTTPDRTANRLETDCVDSRSRRRFLFGVAVASTAGLAGCVGDESDDATTIPTDPVALTGGLDCDACGMVIEEHYGPAGQAIYADGEPTDREGPARFDSVTELLVSLEDADARGWELRAVFVTDYSRVDYELETRDGTTYVSTHAEADAFADVAAVRFVADSDVHGSMGPDHVPFSESEDAEAFADEHGGSVLEWGDLWNR
ncbi:nitrous oxide reductase accessory protein NosL [Halobacteria archaeon AArc-m2/3/4]|uniref:Nitrous oxide reductase accessory protein NosL n=1 Tax=Natronoglomus mannanivorans TaxID=2979990 RepID=A0ABT2QFB6_9EURY|nr:nitrous oxide reductase accessory protein NosL [Halobacteria archaeon AArc-m2/3/4]